MRIVSLLPSTTEILFAIGAGDDVVGVTFECDYPEEARTRRIVSTSAMPEGLTPAEIDAFVVEAMRRGDDLYHLDEGALAGLDADLVVTQDLCAVCAVDVSVVDDALAHLGCTAEVLTIDPHTLDEVFGSIETLGKATGHDEEAAQLVAYQRRRLAASGARGLAQAPAARDVPGVDRPAVRARPLDPGDDRARRRRPGARHERREVARVSWDDVHAAGRTSSWWRRAATTVRAARPSLTSWWRSGVLPDGVPVHAVDANASWARPGTRLVDGIEELSVLLHP